MSGSGRDFSAQGAEGTTQQRAPKDLGTETAARVMEQLTNCFCCHPQKM
jgi:hypothetical protein